MCVCVWGGTASCRLPPDVFPDSVNPAAPDGHHFSEAALSQGLYVLPIIHSIVLLQIGSSVNEYITIRFQRDGAEGWRRRGVGRTRVRFPVPPGPGPASRPVAFRSGVGPRMSRSPEAE